MGVVNVGALNAIKWSRRLNVFALSVYVRSPSNYTRHTLQPPKKRPKKGRVRLVMSLSLEKGPEEDFLGTVKAANPCKYGPFSSPTLDYDLYLQILTEFGEYAAINALNKGEGFVRDYPQPGAVPFICTSCDVKWWGAYTKVKDCWVCGTKGLHYDGPPMY